MSRALETRIAKLESTQGGRVQVLWSDGMNEPEVDAEIERRKASGTLSDLDQRLLIFRRCAGCPAHSSVT